MDPNLLPYTLALHWHNYMYFSGATPDLPSCEQVESQALSTLSEALRPSEPQIQVSAGLTNLSILCGQGP